MTIHAHDQLNDLHQPSLQRVAIPGILIDAPACRECGKAYPCDTAKLLESAGTYQTKGLTDMAALHQYATKMFDAIFDDWLGDLIDCVTIEIRLIDADFQDSEVNVSAYWGKQVSDWIKSLDEEALEELIAAAPRHPQHMALNDGGRTREDIDGIHDTLIDQLEYIKQRISVEAE